jgi:hypothetical protein
MRQRFFLVLLMVFLMVSFAFAAKVVSLTDFYTPSQLEVDDEQFYVVEKAVVFIYSLKDFNLKTKFGKAGEGPQEFKLYPFTQGGLRIYSQKDVLVLNSMGKISFFSKDGKFIKEMKVASTTTKLQPIDSKFIGIAFTIGQGQIQDPVLALYDSRLNKIKEIIRLKFSKGGLTEIPKTPPTYSLWDNKIVTPGDGEGISFDIYDADGNKVLSINKEYKSLKVTDKYKKAVYEGLEREPAMKMLSEEQFKQLKKMIKFKDYFPSIQNFWCADGQIYVQTYFQKDEKYEFFVFDFNGKLLKRIFLPVAYIDAIDHCPTSIKNEKLYQLIENEDEEVWELHITEIE